MKRFILLAISFLTGSIAFGQADKIEHILNQKADIIDKADQTERVNTIFLQTAFGSSEFINLPNLDSISRNTILKVELVYTTFRESEAFDQHALNRKRIYSLNKIAPEILKNEMVSWQMIGQTGCTSPANGKDFFHGFIITYRPLPTKESSEKEIAYMDKILSVNDKIPASTKSLPETTKGSKGKKKSIKPIKIKQTIISSHILYTKNNRRRRKIDELPTFAGGEKALQEYFSKAITQPKKALKKDIQGIIHVTFTIDKTGQVQSVPSFNPISRSRKGVEVFEKEAVRVIQAMPKWTPGKNKGRPVSYERTLRFYFTSKEMKPISGGSDFFESMADTAGIAKLKSEYIAEHFENPELTDSTVFNILERNPTWNKMLVVCDITGSMAPYNAQLLLWYNLNIKKQKEQIASFCFFNDGDSKPDSKKEIGKTGGIYHTKARDFDAVKSVAIKTMKMGFGGDTPENNIEALLEGIEKCGDCNDVVMIADNYATPRDLALLPKVTKPVRLIMCGTEAGVNPEYLDFARKTNGSIHTIEEDITNLMDLSEGESIKIGKKKYKIKNGKFVPVYKM